MEAILLGKLPKNTHISNFEFVVQANSFAIEKRLYVKNPGEKLSCQGF